MYNVKCIIIEDFCLRTKIFNNILYYKLYIPEGVSYDYY